MVFILFIKKNCKISSSRSKYLRQMMGGDLFYGEKLRTLDDEEQCSVVSGL